MGSELEQPIEVITQICGEFFEEKNHKALLQKVLQTSISLMKAERGSVFLLPTEDISSPKPQNRLTSLIATGLEGKTLSVNINEGVVGSVFRNCEIAISNDTKTDPRFHSAIDEETGFRTKSLIAAPLRLGNGKVVGVLQLLNKKNEGFNEQDKELMKILSFFASIAIERLSTIRELQKRNEHLQLEQIEKENLVDVQLKSNNRQLQEIYQKLGIYGESDASVLVQGESGTGKEVIARLIHLNSDRKKEPFVAVNCAAIPESLFEAEMFGVSKGAATGTIARPGKFEMAHGGTLLLDEIGELPLEEQAKLLRVLQDKKITRVGEDRAPRNVDFRLIAATNRNLGKMVQEEKFREDLFYRINVVQLEIPPLRDRVEDLDEICQQLLQRFARKRPQYAHKRISLPAMDKLRKYSWPGNIRQLENRMENALIVSANRELLSWEDFQLDPNGANSKSEQGFNPANYDVLRWGVDLKNAKASFEQELIEAVLEKTGGNKSEASRVLGITREGLRRALMRQVA